jgi:glycosyltransferase involved in cell wall biosynthesis
MIVGVVAESGIEATGTIDAPARYPSVSVLVPAWNEADRIGRCLESLLAIEWPDLDILVAAGGDDGTYGVAQRYAGQRVVVMPQVPGEGKQRALRRLLAASHGEVLYLTDADCVVPAATFQAVLQPIVEQTMEVVTGTYRPYDEDLRVPLVMYRWSIDRAVGRRRGASSEGLSGANMAITRRVLELVGSFDEDVDTGTDYHLARRVRGAGFPIRYVDVAVETEYAREYRLLLRRQSRWLRNTLLHGQRFNDRAAVVSSSRTMATGAAILALPLTVPVTRRWGLAAWLGVLALLGFKRLQYLQALSAEIGRPLVPGTVRNLPAYVLLDLLSWAMPLYDLCFAERRRRW